jgi:hypothetical protein
MSVQREKRRSETPERQPPAERGRQDFPAEEVHREHERQPEIEREDGGKQPRDDGPEEVDIEE